jgi:hypothetical protein
MKIAKIAEETVGYLSEDELCEQITTIKTQIKPLEQNLSILLSELTQRFDTGLIDSNFSHNDFLFSHSLGKVSYDYPENVDALQQTLKQAQEAAKANGTAMKKLGKPFWTVKFPS